MTDRPADPVETQTSSGKALDSRPRARFLVLGSKGRLGRALMEELARRKESARGLDIDELDIADATAVGALLERERPEVVLNAAAYTDVDGAEADEPAARRANVEGPRVLAEAAEATGALLVHVSTDYVFDGEKLEPYTEADLPRPLNVYGRTKLEGEEAVRRSCGRHLIARTAWMFAPWGKNFVSSVLAQARSARVLRVVGDPRGSPTSAIDLAEALVDLAAVSASDPAARGTFHVVNSGLATWRELAEEAIRLAGLGARVEPISAAEAASRGRTVARRPQYSVLSTAKFERVTGRRMRHWHEALADCIRRMASAEGAAENRAASV